jgi:YkoY family integral membrane protein
VHFEWSDLLTVLLLVGLEGILSGDNALVLAVMVMRLPEREQQKALQYGIIGAFILRAIATLLATWLVGIKWVALVGGLYLAFLAVKHFQERGHPEPDPTSAAALAATGLFGLSAFWSTVIKVELTDLVFAVDSILVAVGMTKKTWVIITGGVLGIIMMRMLTMRVLALVKRYPKIIDGAYIVILWVGMKLILEYLHGIHVVPFEIRKEHSILVVIVLFGGSILYAHLDEKRRLRELAAAGDGVTPEALEEPEIRTLVQSSHVGEAAPHTDDDPLDARPTAAPS